MKLLDYREIDDEESFDKIVSVGMFEHVGKKSLPVYFSRAWRLLKPGGLFLNHGISGPASPRGQLRSEFVERYVFPDGELCDIGAALRDAEQAGFEVADVESLRRHYALTLRLWVRRLKENRMAALRYVDELTFRVWELFMTGAAHYFDIGKLNVYQALLSKPTGDGCARLPLSRADLYANGPPTFYIEPDANKTRPSGLPKENI